LSPFFFVKVNLCCIFAPAKKMVVVAQLVRVLVCGAEGRRFEPGQPPRIFKALKKFKAFFVRLFFGKIKRG
jgi:hypothetical protein